MLAKTQTMIQKYVLRGVLLLGIATSGTQIWAQSGEAYSPGVFRNVQYGGGDRGYDRPPRDLVDETVRHLQAVRARNGVFSRREEDRYRNAMRHLIQFQRNMHRGVYDKGKLDEAINDVKNVVDQNPMDPRARDFLARDLENLRRMRARFDRNY